MRFKKNVFIFSKEQIYFIQKRLSYGGFKYLLLKILHQRRTVEKGNGPKRTDRFLPQDNLLSKKVSFFIVIPQRYREFSTKIKKMASKFIFASVFLHTLIVTHIHPPPLTLTHARKYTQPTCTCSNKTSCFGFFRNCFAWLFKKHKSQKTLLLFLFQKRKIERF